MPYTGRPWPPCWCSVCSMKPSPPSAQITSASAGSCCWCVAVSVASACSASGVPLDTKAIFGSAGRFIGAEYLTANAHDRSRFRFQESYTRGCWPGRRNGEYPAFSAHDSHAPSLPMRTATSGSTPDAGDSRLAWLVVAMFVLLTLPRLLSHETWRDEAWEWLVVIESQTL